MAGFVFNLALKTYGTLEMFLLSAQNNFYIILSSYVDGAKKIKSEIHVFNWKSGCFFRKFTVELVSKSFSDGNDSLDSPVLEFSNTLLYGLEKLREL